MRRALAAALAAAVAGCAPVAPPAAPAPSQSLSPSVCQARGGTLRPVGRLQTLRCVVRYGDAGKRCHDGADCQGDCRAEPDRAPAPGPATGRCQADSDGFGCFSLIDNGRAGPAICID